MLILEQSIKISEYVKIVCEQIRWKKAHSIISDEIENHIVDQRNEFISQGLDEELATDKAILEMGDPIIVGSELDSTHRPKIEWSVIAITGIMLLLGIGIRYFVTPDYQMQYKLIDSIVSSIIGMIFMSIAYFLDFSIIGKYPKRIYFSLIAITLGVMVISPTYMGQSFYVKFLMLLFPTAYAGIIYNMRSKGYMGIIISGLYYIVPAIICLSIPSFSSLAMYSISCLILLTFAIGKGWFKVKKLNALLLVCVPTVITSIFILFVFKFNNYYMLARLRSALNPSLDPKGWGWMATNTRRIIGNAKFLGYNQYGINTEGLLPNMDTDFLLTYLIDRIGWISFIVIMLVMITFIIRSLKLSIGQRAVLGGLVSTAVITTFIIQVIFYVVSNLGFQLFEPIGLPLITYGKLSIVINMFLIGVMLSVYKSGYLHRNDDILTAKENKTFQYIDGKIIIDLK